jgi:Arc/MetJ-type ribon-helix-helix transcriptional regulator
MHYHMTMARKEVLVQLDDKLVAELDRLAVAQGTSRSDLVRRSVLALLEAADVAQADRELQDAYRRTPPDPALVAAARRLAADNTPSW